MSSNHQITDNFIERKLNAVMAGFNDRFFRDAKRTGFGLRVRRLANGNLGVPDFYAHWYVNDGKDFRKILIGSASTYTVDEAWAFARKKLQLVDQGIDPKTARAERLAAPSFEDMLKDFREGHLSEKEPATVKDYEGRIRRILEPTFKGMKVADITPAMIDAMRRKYRTKKTDLNRALAVLSKMMSLAVQKQWRADNPVKGIERFKEKERDTWLDELDLPEFLKVLATKESPVADLVRFLAVSGWRVTKARQLRWDQVDLRRLTVKLTSTANKGSATHLSADAATVIDRQEGRLGYVFSNTGGRMPISYKLILTTLKDICDEAEIPYITPHALRHTAASWAAINGATAHQLKQAFNWKTLAMTNRYVGRSESLARAGVEKAAGAINVLNKPRKENVEPITSHKVR